MKHPTTLLMSFLAFASIAHGAGPKKFTVPYNSTREQSDGNITIDGTVTSGTHIAKNYYGADVNGFVELPKPDYVTPLNLGYVKFGGELMSVFNWKLNMYLDPVTGIEKVYTPLDKRIQYARTSYQNTPLLQINMLGLQPDYDSQGKLSMQMTATKEQVANQLIYLNGTKALGVKNILMGNEPFSSFETHGVRSPSADEYIEKYIQYAVALRDAQVAAGGQASDLKLWGPEIETGWTGWQTNHPTDCTVKHDAPGGMACSYGHGQFSEFIPYFLSRIAAFEKDKSLNPKGYKLLDYLTLHYYPLFRSNFADKGSIIVDANGNQNVAGMLESVNVWTSPGYINKYDHASPRNGSPQIVNRFKNWRDKYYPDAKLAVTEFGVDSRMDIAYHPIVRPLYLADLMGRLAQAGVDTFVNSFLQGSHDNDSWAMINNDNRSRLYWIYSLFSGNYAGDVIKSTSSYGDKVTTYSIKTPTGVNVIVINKDTIDHTSGLSMNETSGTQKLSDVRIPAWSLTVISIPNDHSSMTVQQYGAKEMGIPVSPMPVHR